jgi:hypothetical protein
MMRAKACTTTINGKKEGRKDGRKKRNRFMTISFVSGKKNPGHKCTK